MHKSPIGNKADIVLLSIAAILAISPFYTFGYLLLCVYGGRKLYFVKALNTHFANFILTFLLLCASIMIAGVFTSYANIPNLAIINFITTLFFIVTLAHLQPVKEKNKLKAKLYDVTDIASVCAALLIPLISVIMIMSAIGYGGMVYRMAATGAWDGVQHFSFLQVNSINNNYILDTSPVTVDGEKIANDYPQGWHLASVNIANGVYPDVFIPESTGMKVSLSAYAIVVFMWYFLVVYLILKFIAYQLGPEKKSLLRAILLIIVAQFVAVTILLPMWTIGFVNFIGLLVFMVLLVMHSHQQLNEKEGDGVLFYVALTSIGTAAVGLVWVLPVAFCVFLAILVVLTTKKLPALNAVKVLQVLIPVLMSLVAFILYLRLLMTSLDEEKYLFVTPGWMPQFPTATVGLVCLAIAVAIAYKQRLDINKYSSILLAFFIPLTAIYFVSYLKLNDLGYYQVKLFGIVFVIISMFMLAIVVRAAENVNESNISLFNSILSAGVAISVLGSIFVLSGHNMNISMLHRSPKYAIAAEEKMIIHFAYNASNSKTQAVVLNKDMKPSQINGSGLFNRRSSDVTAKFISVDNLANRPDTCLVYVFFDMSGGLSPPSEDRAAIFNRLDGCLKVRSGEGYNSKIFAPETMRAEISTVNVHNAEVIYY